MNISWYIDILRWFKCKFGNHVWRYKREWGGDYPGLRIKSFCQHCKKQGKTIYDYDLFND
jgi:hypothetical protein